MDRLINDGFKVIVIDNESAECNNEFYYNDKAEYYKYDIEDYDLIEPLFKGIDYVFHLAAESRIQPTLDRPVKACMTNIIGTCNILEASRRNDIKRVMYSSTSSAYGLKNKIPLKETMGRDCLNPYSVTKAGAEDLCKMYYTLYGLETVIFRYFNVYGERQPLKGQYAPVVGLFLEMKKAGKPMTVVGDGLQTRDYTYVKDVVEAIKTISEYAGRLALDETDDWFDGVTVKKDVKEIQDSVKLFEKTAKEVGTLQHRLEAMYENIGGKLSRYYVVEANILAMNSNNKKILAEIFNVGTGTNHSVLDLVDMIEGEHIHLPVRLGEAKDTLADNNKLITMLNWQPKETIDNWIQKYKMEVVI